MNVHHRIMTSQFESGGFKGDLNAVYLNTGQPWTKHSYLVSTSHLTSHPNYAQSNNI